MTVKDLTHLLIRIAGMAVIIYSVITIPNYISSYTLSGLHDFKYFIFAVVVPSFLSLGIGIWLFLAYEKISNIIIRRNPEVVEENKDFTSKIFEQIALSVLGFYLLFDILSNSSYGVASWFFAVVNISNKVYRPAEIDKTYMYILIVCRGMEFIFSLWLILGSKGIVNFLHKVREPK